MKNVGLNYSKLSWHRVPCNRLFTGLFCAGIYQTFCWVKNAQMAWCHPSHLAAQPCYDVSHHISEYMPALPATSADNDLALLEGFRTIWGGNIFILTTNDNLKILSEAESPSLWMKYSRQPQHLFSQVFTMHSPFMKLHFPPVFLPTTYWRKANIPLCDGTQKKWWWIRTLLSIHFRSCWISRPDWCVPYRHMSQLSSIPTQRLLLPPQAIWHHVQQFWLQQTYHENLHVKKLVRIMITGRPHSDFYCLWHFEVREQPESSSVSNKHALVLMRHAGGWYMWSWTAASNDSNSCLERKTDSRRIPLIGQTHCPPFLTAENVNPEVVKQKKKKKKKKKSLSGYRAKKLE